MISSAYGTTYTHTHSYTRRPAEPGGSAYGVGVVGRSLSGVARGQRALLEADDAVGDVRGVRVDRRHADRREVVREVGSPAGQFTSPLFPRGPWRRALCWHLRVLAAAQPLHDNIWP